MARFANIPNDAMRLITRHLRSRDLGRLAVTGRHGRDTAMPILRATAGGLNDHFRRLFALIKRSQLTRSRAKWAITLTGRSLDGFRGSATTAWSAGQFTRTFNKTVSVDGTTMQLSGTVVMQYTGGANVARVNEYSVILQTKRPGRRSVTTVEVHVHPVRRSIAVRIPGARTAAHDALIIDAATAQARQAFPGFRVTTYTLGQAWTL